MNERELLQLKERIDQAKAKTAELRGRREYLMQELKDKWGCSTIKQAEIKFESMTADVETLNSKIIKASEQLQEMLETQI